MSVWIEAIYEKGVFRPLEPVQLSEGQLVTLTIETALPVSVDHAHFVLSEERWKAFCDALEAPSRDIPALRKLLTEEDVWS